jgi:hypothetical protein
MSTDPDHRRSAVAPGAEAAPERPRLERRLFIFRAALLIGAGGALETIAMRGARAQGCTDQDPDDMAGSGRNCGAQRRCVDIDQDPVDPPTSERPRRPPNCGDPGYAHRDSSPGGGTDRR